jgi:molybdenum cofactor biosynthesis protein MoaC
MIYRFEELDETLDLVPLAARRALDRAGSKVSLAAWRAASLEVRRAVISAGAEADVDPDRVRKALSEGGVPFEWIACPEEPHADRVPSDLEGVVGPAVGDETWRALSSLDRYALAKIARKAGVSDRLDRALSEIVVVAEPRLTHLSVRGEAHMVDVGAKGETLRRAVARAHVHMKAATVERLRSGTTPKGDVLAVARVAGIQAAKRTPELIPLCHTLRLTSVTVDLRLEPTLVRIDATVEAVDRTGVEMEALVAASTAALAVYDMLKGIDRGMTIDLALYAKTGGAGGTWAREGSDSSAEL